MLDSLLSTFTVFIKKSVVQNMFFYINICFKNDFAISLYMFVLCCFIDVQLLEWRLLPTRTIISQTSCRRSDPPRDNARSFDHLHIQRSRWLNHGLKFHGVKLAKVAANLKVFKHDSIWVYRYTKEPSAWNSPWQVACHQTSWLELSIFHMLKRQGISGRCSDSHFPRNQKFTPKSQVPIQISAPLFDWIFWVGFVLGVLQL